MLNVAQYHCFNSFYQAHLEYTVLAWHHHSIALDHTRIRLDLASIYKLESCDMKYDNKEETANNSKVIMRALLLNVSRDNNSVLRSQVTIAFRAEMKTNYMGTQAHADYPAKSSGPAAVR